GHGEPASVTPRPRRSKRLPRPDSVERGNRQIGEPLEALRAATLLEESSRLTDEGELADGVDPEDRRACADAAERARGRGEAEAVRERALAAQKEAQTEIDREIAPAVHLARVVEEVVAHRAGLVGGGEIDDGRRQHAYPVELAA